MWLTEKPIAHRGLWSREVPENSLEAFENAVQEGHPIELDVQMLADGTLVVFHDWTLDRMTSVEGKLSQKTYDEMAHVTLNNSTQKIPRLEEVLQVVQGSVPLLIEMKNRNHKRSEYIEKLLAVLGEYDGVFVLSSFDPFLVKKVKKHFKGVLCGQNFSNYPKNKFLVGQFKKVFMYVSWTVSNNTPDFFVCRASMLPQCWIVRTAAKRKKPLLTWAIGDESEYKKVRGYADNYIFDHQHFS